MLEKPNYGLYSVNKQDWSLHRKANIDSDRHKQRIKEAIKNNMGDIIKGDIFSGEGNGPVQIPIHELDQYKFRFDPDHEKGVGTGNGKSKVGDVVQSDDGEGAGAGNDTGTHAYIDPDMVDEVVLEELGLPLDRKGEGLMPDKTYTFTDVRKKGIMSNLDKKRTIFENLKRNAAAGDPHFKNVKDDDLRFKTWEVNDKQPQSQAVLLALRDLSGSMGPFETAVTRNLIHFLVKNLQRKYPAGVEVAYIGHEAEAFDMSEKEFYGTTSGGGTVFSSGYNHILELTKTKYNPQQWNIFPIHLTDGDNYTYDNAQSIDLVRQLLKVSNMFGFVEIAHEYMIDILQSMGWGKFSGQLDQIKDDKMKIAKIKTYDDVLPALKQLFPPVSNEGALPNV